jgi:hypothetical protein
MHPAECSYDSVKECFSANQHHSSRQCRQATRPLLAIPAPETKVQRHRLAWLISVTIACSSLAQAAPTAAGKDDAALAARVAKVLADTPLIDRHNDLPWEMRARGDVDGKPLVAD